jgi:hypothetical protein
VSPGGNSRDPEARARSLANLKRGNNPPPRAGSPLQPARRHGAYAQVARASLEAKQREVFEALSADVPLRDEAGGLPGADAVVVRLLAECLCRLDGVAAHLRDHGLIDSRTGDPRPAVEIEIKLRREARELAEGLGMTPRSRVALGIDVQRGIDLARAAADDFEREREGG